MTNKEKDYTYPQNIGKQIAIARQAHSLTQTQLGELVGCHRSHIARIETGTLDSRLSTIGKICEVLNVDLMIPEVDENIYEILKQRQKNMFISVMRRFLLKLSERMTKYPENLSEEYDNLLRDILAYIGIKTKILTENSERQTEAVSTESDDGIPAYNRNEAYMVLNEYLSLTDTKCEHNDDETEKSVDKAKFSLFYDGKIYVGNENVHMKIMYRLFETKLWAHINRNNIPEDMNNKAADKDKEDKTPNKVKKQIKKRPTDILKTVKTKVTIKKKRKNNKSK